MRKILFAVIFTLFFLNMNAQELMSKKGTQILPEAKDWSIGFDASPLIKYAGNFFNHSDNNNSLMNYQDSITLVGLYMKDANTAYRAKVRLSFISEKWTAHVPDQLNSLSTVNDERNYSQFAITLGLGIQKMRGKGRLKGIYGAEGLIMIGTAKNDYSYGNPIDDTHQTPASTDWTDALHADNDNPSPSNLDNSSGLIRATSFKYGSVFNFGVRGFIGAEYFFAPKLSLSAEYGWSILFGNRGENEATYEAWNGSSTASQTTQLGKKSIFGADVDHAGGLIVLHAYF